MRIRALLAEPMLHFVLLGLVLFAGYRLRSGGGSGNDRIVITQDVVDDLVTQHTAARGRPPSSAELEHMIDAYVRDEILYREGVALGLDRDDIVVKRRVRQKLGVMLEEEAAVGEPTEVDLSAYLAAHRERFKTPAVITFEQVPARYGRPSLLPDRMTRTGSDVIARTFGAAFANALEHAPVGEWSGPIESEYGAHYVRVLERTASVMPQLVDARAQVLREWENERRQRAFDEAYARMRSRYKVRLEATLPAGGQWTSSR